AAAGWSALSRRVRCGQPPTERRAQFAAVDGAANKRFTRLPKDVAVWRRGQSPVWEKDVAMYKHILVPIDLSDPELAKPAIATAVSMAQSNGTLRLINVLPLTPVMLAEYVPPDFEAQQRKAAEDALAIIGKEVGLEAPRVSSTVRQGGVHQEILEEAKAIHADLIVMSSHRP